MPYFDSHCHLQFKAYDENRDEVIGRCLERGMQMLTVGTQKDMSKAAVELAKTCRGQIYASIGLHPIHLHPRYVDEKEGAFTSREEDFDYDFYKELAQDETVVAIGETGLDFYHIPEDIPREEVIEKQKDVFLQHIKLAQELNKAIVIHCRDAYKELADLLDNEIPLLCKEGPGEVSKKANLKSKIGNRKLKGTVHCFTGNEEEVERLIKRGLLVGFTGVITFPPRKSNPEAQERLLEAVRRVPLDQLLIETDAPYLAPAEYRGKRCEPWMVEEVAKKVAELKETDVQTIMQVTSENGHRLFGIDRNPDTRHG
tara:strand:- start:126 stop:1064 length:939 start_codon:yes stop_codon:yes gene_type:complete